MTKRADRILDEFLIAAARTGDRRAFGALVVRWNGRLVAHAWRVTGDPEMARDAAQEAWMEIVRGLHRLADDRAFPAWAYRIVTRRCAKQIGKAVRGRRIADTAALEPAPCTTETDAEGAVEAHQLRDAIALLPPDQRSAIALFYLEDLSVAEIAVALDTPMGTIKTRLLHARLKLRRALKGD